MDREIVFLALAMAFCGPALLLLGFWRGRLPSLESGLALERHAWRQVWFPVAPAALVLAALIGWALVEPQDAEPVSRPVGGVALVFGLLGLRAMVRAARSALVSPGEGPAVTVGLFRPRVMVSARLVGSLDRAALAAAEAHELAHARHRDPLRIWLAQLATDLQWPWPAASKRFRRWLRALELARDEEARSSGVCGEDLAAAIITAARLQLRQQPTNSGTLVGEERGLEERIRRLLIPLEVVSGVNGRRTFALVAGVGLALAGVFGAMFGEAAVRAVLGAPP